MSAPERPQPDGERGTTTWWSIAATLLVLGGFTALLAIGAYALGVPLGYCIAVGFALLAILMGSAIWRGLDLIKAEADKPKGAGG